MICIKRVIVLPGWERTAQEESVTKLSKIGVQSIVFHPCGNTPVEGEWLSVMKGNANALARIYSATE